MKDYATIRSELADAVLTITLARPDKLNAVTPTMTHELVDALAAGVSAGARAVILTGEGRLFCSGADLSDSDPSGMLAGDLGDTLANNQDPLTRALAALPIPLVTALNGPAAGVGVALALAGDIIVAGRSSYFLLPFVNIGLVPDGGATWLIAKAIGRTRTLEMALLGDRLPAERAFEMGLITRLVDDTDVASQARELALRLAAKPTVAVGLIRSQVATALNGDLETTLQVERQNQSAAGKSSDFQEGVAAFLEKRPPVFTGR